MKEWIAENANDKSLCMHFEAFSTQQSYDAAQNPSKYSDDELQNIPTGVTYTNNPNTQYEGWTDSRGDEHVIHPAD